MTTVSMQHLTRLACRDRWMLPATWVLSAVYLTAFVHVGWIPHDEGVIGQSAERVLLGELPHRDFVDVYTGGLSFLHAAAFRLMEIHLLVPRLVLYGFVLAWIPCVYWIGRRFATPLAAAAITFACVAWSFPHYFVALPSWYNLFFATAAAAALLKFVESRNSWCLAVAGVSTGLSITAKITGLFAVAGCLLFILYLEADDEPRGGRAAAPLSKRGHLTAIIAIVASFLGLLLVTLRSQISLGVAVHFFLPAALVSGLIVQTEASGIAQRSLSERLPRLSRDVLAFTAGVLLPLVAYAAPFIAAGAFGELVNGVLVVPSERLTQAVWPPPPVWLSVPALVILAVLVYRISRLQPAGALILGMLLLLIVRFAEGAYAAVLIATQVSVPLVVAAGVVLVARRRRDEAVPPVRRRQATALLFLLALCTLVQFPYAYRIYFLYVAPLVILAGAALYSLGAAPQRRLLAGALVFTIVFATTWMNHRFPAGLGYHYRHGQQSAAFAVARGDGLRVPSGDAAVYRRVVYLLQVHSQNGYTVAGPDAPEVYFLSGLHNPTPHLFEFFAEPDLEQRLLAAIDSLDITAVAINREPSFTARFSPEFMAQLEARFTGGEEVGRYVVVWRE